MSHKIFITGCARSGTTLLHRCFFAFENAKVIIPEINIKSFVEYDSTSEFIVGKRTENHIFGTKKSNIDNQAKLIKDNNIHIVNIIRDGRDVVEEPNKITCSWWNNAISQAINYSHLIDLNVFYEDLVNTPNFVQLQIWTYFSELKHKYKFSEYPTFIPHHAFEYMTNKPRYNISEISTNRISKNLEIYKFRGTTEEIKEFEEKLKYLGYE